MDAQELQKLKNKFDIIGNDPALNRALEMAVAVARTDLPVLVTGESGVGKENIPNIIHQFGRRRTEKYFAVNCGAIAEGTIDSELFGHEKGSFTGAVDSRKGYFEEANGGTLFLDEVGELPLPSQAKLLRVLQSGEYIRVGSSKVCKTDVRVIAASNVDLSYAVAQGKFREDLFYRLNGVNIQMPPLRERRDDIYLLFRKFAADFSDKYGMRKITLDRAAIQLLMSYRWPGNIRQLKNLAQTVATMESAPISPGNDRQEVGAATLAKYIPKDSGDLVPALRHPSGEGSALNEDEKQEIYKALYSLNAEVQALKRIVQGWQEGGHIALTAPEGSSSGDTPEDIDEQEGIAENAPQQPAEEIEDLSIRKLSDDLIRKALEKHGGNRKKAAEELGISERTLYRKLPAEYKSIKHS